MDAVNIEKWLEENTFQCPMGRVSLQQCEALRKRRKFGEGGFISSAEKIKDIYMPKACENCTLWKTLSKNKHIKRVVKVINEKETATCQDCGKEFEPYKNGPSLVKNYCKECFTARRLERKKRKDKMLLTIDFFSFPSIPDLLKKAANKDVRTLEYQALAYIIKGLEADGFDVERGEG